MPLDIFDELELTNEDRFLVSGAFKKALEEELEKQIDKLPLEKIAAQVIQKELDRRDETVKGMKETTVTEMKKSHSEVTSKVTKIGDEIESKLKSGLSKVRDEMDEFMKKIRKKYDDLRSEILNQPQYQFGGYSPQMNDLVIGPPTTEGSWRIVQSGDNLVVERYESGAWVEKGRFEP